MFLLMNLSDIFREQAVALIQGGVDLLLIETSQDILEVKAAILGIQTGLRRDRYLASNPGSGHTGYNRSHAFGY